MGDYLRDTLSLTGRTDPIRSDEEHTEMPQPGVSLEDLAAQSNVPTEDLPDEGAFEQEMAQRGRAPAANARPRTRQATGPRMENGQLVGGLTGLPVGPRPAADAAAPIERAPSGVVVQNEDMDFDLTDSQGDAYQITVPAGTRYNVSHEHNGDARRPSCAVCMGIWEHEKTIRQTAAPATASSTRQMLQEATTYDMGTDSAGNEWSYTVPAGATIIVREGHEHANKRIPTCALCMAINEHEREIRPQAAPKEPNPCECGCGGETKSRFCPGHDARLYGRVRKYNNWAEENAEKIASGEVSITAAPDYDLLPEKVRTEGVLKTGHGDVVLAGHPIS